MSDITPEDVRSQALINVRNDVSNIDRRLSQQEYITGRFDNAIDKISEVSLNVSKLLAVHEQRLETQESISRSVQEHLEERRKDVDSALASVNDKLTAKEQGLRTEMANYQKEILEEIKSLRGDMAELNSDITDKQEQIKKDIEEDVAAQIEVVNDRVSKLERMGWIAVGGATVIGFILSQIVGIADLFK